MYFGKEKENAFTGIQEEREKKLKYFPSIPFLRKLFKKNCSKFIKIKYNKY